MNPSRAPGNSFFVAEERDREAHCLYTGERVNEVADAFIGRHGGKKELLFASVCYPEIGFTRVGKNRAGGDESAL
jgi:hypothetical protein